MRLEEPSWWYADPVGGDLTTRILAPIGRLVGSLAEARYKRKLPYRSRLPVICIGNFTVGGTGKTPLALLVAEHLTRQGERPACLTRGYGGTSPGPIWVPASATAREVGEEALLVARSVPTLVSRDRANGARMIEEAPWAPTAIVMDDGMQNAGLGKDLVIAVVDGSRGLGNGHVIPAGPLRAPLEFQLGLVDCIVVNGRAGEGADGSILERLKGSFPGPVLAAHAEPVGDVEWLRETPVIAYAGIGNPKRFFRLLAEAGARSLDEHAFGDHHAFTEREADELLAGADRKKAQLVTTEKDWIRLTGATGRRAELQARSRVLAIRLAFDERDFDRLASLIEATVKSGGG